MADEVKTYSPIKTPHQSPTATASPQGEALALNAKIRGTWNIYHQQNLCRAIAPRSSRFKRGRGSPRGLGRKSEVAPAPWQRSKRHLFIISIKKHTSGQSCFTSKTIKMKPKQMLGLLNLESGGALSSRAVASQVLSTREGLTSVFGMGTGVTPQPKPPENG